MTGDCASARVLAAFSTASCAAGKAAEIRVGRSRIPPEEAFKISPGMERNTGPVGGVNATLTPRLTACSRSTMRRTS